MKTFFYELKYAVRALRRNLAFTALGVVVLSLGIAATCTIFSVVSVALIAPLPYPVPDRLMVLWQSDERAQSATREAFSAPDYLDLLARQRVFESVTGFQTAPRNMVVAERPPARVTVTAATPSFFQVYGLTPSLGRGFTDADAVPGAENVAVLNASSWQAVFASDPGVIGRRVTLNGQQYTVVGVFGRPTRAPGGTTEIFVPLRIDPVANARGRHLYGVTGRLKANATPEQAQADVAAIGGQLASEFAADNVGRALHARLLQDDVAAPVRPRILLLMLAVAALFVMTCVNIVSVLLSRAIERREEAAVRLALGATPLRCISGFVAEGLILASVAGVIGLAAAAVIGIPLLKIYAPFELPPGVELALDIRTFLFTFALTVVAGLICGAIPATEVLRGNLSSRLHERTATIGSSASVRLRHALVIAEIAISVVLLSGAVLLANSLRRLAAVNPGFTAQQVLKARIDLPAARYPQSFATFPEWPEVRQFSQRILEGVRQIDGVDAVAVAYSHPLDSGFTSSFSLFGRPVDPSNREEIRIRMVSADYFRTVGLPLVGGRYLDEHDRDGQPLVAVINEAAVRRYFGKTSPIGERISIFDRPLTIVGVVGDEHFLGLERDVPPAVYPSLTQMPTSSLTLLIRSAQNPSALVPQVRRAVSTLDPRLPIYDVETMTTVLDRFIAQPRLNSVMVAAFAGMAWLLTIVGVYGVVSYSVVRREREMWLRLAFGATPPTLLRLIMRESAVVAIVGLVIGLLGAVPAGRFMTSLLYRGDALDPLVFTGVAVTLFITVLGGAFIPARRLLHARVDGRLLTAT